MHATYFLFIYLYRTKNKLQKIKPAIMETAQSKNSHNLREQVSKKKLVILPLCLRGIGIYIR